MQIRPILKTDTPVIAKWFEADTCKRLLLEIAGCDDEDRPSRFRCSDRLAMGPKEWIEWDREDPRVIALQAARGGYLDLALALGMVADAGVATEIDAAIDAAVAFWDAKFAKDRVYAECLDAGMTMGAARAQAYGSAAA